MSRLHADLATIHDFGLSLAATFLWAAVLWMHFKGGDFPPGLSRILGCIAVAVMLPTLAVRVLMMLHP